MRHSLFVIAGMALGCALVLSPVAWADDGARCLQSKSRMMEGHGRHHGHAISQWLRHLLRHTQEVGLSAEQVTQLRVVGLDAERGRIRALADVMVSERELRALLRDQAELPAIEAKVREKTAFQATVRMIGIKAKRDLTGILTLEQRAKANALREQRRHPERGRLMKAEAVASAEKEDPAAPMNVPEIGMSETENRPSGG